MNSRLKELRRQTLFWRFSALALFAFVVMTIFVILAIRPAIEEFVLTDAERQIVVFVNRVAGRALAPGDFAYPSTDETRAKLQRFSGELPIRGLTAVVIHDSDGRVLYSSLSSPLPPDENERRYRHDQELIDVLEQGDEHVGFKQVSPEETALLGVSEVFEAYTPITFGASGNPVGVVHTFSRTGFIRESIIATQRDIARRIIGASAGLYLILSVIVYGASRTIVRQADGLREYAAKLAESLQKEKELSAAKDRFLRIASHQLNTPVSEIGWAVETISEPKISREIFQTAIQSIENGFRNLQNIVSDILTVSEIGMRYEKTQSEKLDIAELTREALLLVAPRAREKKLTIQFVPQYRVPAVDANRFAMGRVLRNLIDNAVTYSNDGGLIRVTVSAGKKRLIWRIKDQGIGIPRQEQPRIFEQFFRAKNSVEKKNVGTGLGLFISKTIVEGHGGTIDVESEPGKGTTFSVALPIYEEKGV